MHCEKSGRLRDGDKELREIRKTEISVCILRRIGLILAAALLAGCAAGCARQIDSSKKQRDLEFTVLDKEDIPEELGKLIEEKKEDPFRISFADQGLLYIAEGYGARPTSGYSVEVSALYETEDAVCMHTTLMGPEKDEEIKEAVTYPYVAVRLGLIEKEVLFD